MPSYNAGKACCVEASAASGSLFESAPALVGEALWQFLLTQKAKNDLTVATFNWAFVSALSDWAGRPGFMARHRQFDQVTLAGMQRARLVTDIIAVKDGTGSMVAVDPRRAEMLSAKGLLVVQSLVHHLIRVQHPDLESLDITILQFPETGTLLPNPNEVALADSEKIIRRRVCVENRLGVAEPIEWAVLSGDVEETLRIFREVVRGAEIAPIRPTGSEGLFPGF